MLIGVGKVGTYRFRISHLLTFAFGSSARTRRIQWLRRPRHCGFPFLRDGPSEMLAIRLVCFALICLAAADDSNESADSGSSEEDDCTCVPFHLCPNGVQGYDGSGKIVFKLDSDRPNKCSTYSLRSCCKSKSQPLTSTTTPKPANRVGCGRRNSHGIVYKIVDDAGIASQFGEFPWMTMIYMEREGTEVKREIIPQCGGALIHEKVVLTAAHCAAKLTIPSAGVRLGEWDLRTETEQWSHQDRSITKMISHENYDPDHLYNDVALLVLGENVTIGNHIDILCLPRANDVVVNSTCVATGWGKNLTGNYQHVLKMVELPMVARDECQAKLRTLPGFENFELHESFTCAGGVEGKDTCKGDGGGALACPIPGHPGRYQQVGIVAWGPADCGKPVPAVYVDVAHFRSWIDQKMSQLGFETEYTY